MTPPGTLSQGHLLAMAAPLSAAALATPFVAMAAATAIGHLDDASLLAGVAAANVIVSLVFFTFNFLRSSTTAMVAQATGAGRGDEALAAGLRAALLAFAIGAAALALALPLSGLAFRLLGLAPDAAAAAGRYFGLRIWSAPLLLAQYAVVGWLFGLGRVWTGVALEMLLNALNLGLLYALVFRLGQGLEGAAWATVLAEAATAAVGLGLLLGQALPRRREGGGGRLLRRILDARQVRRTLSVNSDILVRSLLLFAAIAIFTRLSATLGTRQMAANAVLLNVFYLSGAVVQGFATVAQLQVGRMIGAGDRAALDRAVLQVAAWGVGISILVAALLLALHAPALALLAPDPAVRADAAALFALGVLTGPVGSLAFILDGVFIGASWSRALRNWMALSVAFFLPTSALLSQLAGATGLWLAFLAFLLARGLTLLRAYRRERRGVPAADLAR